MRDRLVRDQRIRLSAKCPVCRGLTWGSTVEPKADVLGKWHHPSCIGARFPRQGSLLDEVLKSIPPNEVKIMGWRNSALDALAEAKKELEAALTAIKKPEPDGWEMGLRLTDAQHHIATALGVYLEACGHNPKSG